MLDTDRESQELVADAGRGAGFRVATRALGALALFAVALVPAALGGRARAARVWLRGCTQAGHLWALFGGDYAEYGAAR